MAKGTRRERSKHASWRPRGRIGWGWQRRPRQQLGAPNRSYTCLAGAHMEVVLMGCQFANAVVLLSIMSAQSVVEAFPRHPLYTPPSSRGSCRCMDASVEVAALSQQIAQPCAAIAGPGPGWNQGHAGAPAGSGRHHTDKKYRGRVTCSGAYRGKDEAHYLPLLRRPMYAGQQRHRRHDHC